MHIKICVAFEYFPSWDFLRTFNLIFVIIIFRVDLEKNQVVANLFHPIVYCQANVPGLKDVGYSLKRKVRHIYVCLSGNSTTHFIPVKYGF